MPGDQSSVAAIVLAAGASRRMGQGRNKMLFELDGEPLVRRAARRAVEAQLSPVVIVLGHEADRLRAALEGLACEPVVNPGFAGPLSSSVHRGLAQLPVTCSAALVALADMIHVTVDMLARLRDVVQRDDAPIIASRYGDVIAPPVVFRRPLFQELLAWSGEGFRGIVERHRAATAFVEWSPEALKDVDTAGDFPPYAGTTRDL